MVRPAAPTIFAVATPPGRSAIAVFRLSGPSSSRALELLTNAATPPARQAALRWLTAPGSGERIDQALVTFFPAPHSYTGEDLLEIGVHGGRAVVAALAEILQAFPGIKPAEPGEFTRRAFQNGKLDLTQAEGIADHIDSETEFQRRQALRVASGGLREKVAQWREIALQIAAELESQLDFSDEGDVGENDFRLAASWRRNLEVQLQEELRNGERSGRLRNGISIVLAGPPNAGKSTLFNGLVGMERAIVSAHPGTTRDLLYADIDIEGFPVTLIDSAGLRESGDDIEQIGMDRARAAVEAADIVLWLNAHDAVAEPVVGDRRFLRVWTKADLGQPAPAGWMELDCRSSADLHRLVESIVPILGSLAGDGAEGLVLRSRQRDAVGKGVDACDRLGAHLATGNIELAAEECRDVLDALESLGGGVDIEDLLGEVFGRFCIGK